MSLTRADPRSVGAVVRAVWMTRAVILALECALLFVAGDWLAQSAALLSGDEDRAWSVALLCGFLCAASWWLEHPLDRAGAARVLDRRLGHAGALLTAFELEEARRPLSTMEELVRTRVLARLGRAEALRVALPSLAVPLAAPLLAAVVLVLVVDRRGPERGGVERAAADAGGLVEGLERALASGALASEGAGAAQAAAVRAEVRALATRIAADRSAVDRADLEALDRRVAALARTYPPASEAEARLAEARVWLDALRTRLGERAPEPAAAGAPGTGAGELTDARADGTISGSFPDPTPPLRPDAVSTDSATTDLASTEEAAADAELGRQAGVFWPAEYDAVVARWIELSRAARDGSGR